MRNLINILTGFLISISVFSCNSDANKITDCNETIVYDTQGYGHEIKSTSRFYNNNGFIYRSNIQVNDSQYDYYENYTYDANNNLIEYYRSDVGYRKYYYDSDLRIKQEYYDLDMNLAGFFTLDYIDGQIVRKNRYTNIGPDTTIKDYYYNGLIDSIVETRFTEETILIDKMAFKYDSQGNNTEKIRYSNHSSENIEIIRHEIYTYNEDSQKIKSESYDKDGSLEYGVYLRYYYNDLGNLIETKVYNSNDSLVNSHKVIYTGCGNLKLITPEI